MFTVCFGEGIAALLCMMVSMTADMLFSNLHNCVCEQGSQIHTQ